VQEEAFHRVLEQCGRPPPLREAWLVAILDEAVLLKQRDVRNQHPLRRYNALLHFAKQLAYDTPVAGGLLKCPVSGVIDDVRASLLPWASLDEPAVVDSVVVQRLFHTIPTLYHVVVALDLCPALGNGVIPRWLALTISTLLPFMDPMKGMAYCEQ